MSELSILDLDRESGDLLPTRETLALVNFTGIIAGNSSVAVNALTAFSFARSSANQAIFVLQR
jgi:hypothetical protein